MHISPDAIIIARIWGLPLNGTIVFTWAVMVFLAVGSWLVTRRLSEDIQVSRWQMLLETVVDGMRQQIREVSRREPAGYFSFLGTLFLFVAVSNILSIVPGFTPPTGSLSTTAALALCVFMAVPVYGIWQAGWLAYFKNYLQPTFFMLPFNIMGELTRTLALAVRLFGNVMSGTMIGAILLAIAPLILPVLMQLLGLLTGLVQAYIFAVLAAVYIGAAMEIRER